MGDRLAPVGAGQARSAAEAARQRPRPVRCQRSGAAPAMSQAPRREPDRRQRAAPRLHRPGEADEREGEGGSAAQRAQRAPGRPASTASSAPAGRISASATMKGVKAASKKGAPTDSLRPKASSATSGQIVPTKTTKAATASRMLLATSALSRLTRAKTPLASIACARAA